MFGIKREFKLNMFISIVLLLILIPSAIMQIEAFIHLLLWSMVAVNLIWVFYYDRKSNGITAVKNRISKKDERFYIKSYIRLLASFTVSFLIIAIGKFAIMQQIGVFAIVFLISMFVGILVSLYEIIRIIIGGRRTAD